MPSSDPCYSLQPSLATDLSKSPSRLSLCNDVVFKALFCRYPHLLSDLFNAVRYSVPVVQVHPTFEALSVPSRYAILGVTVISALIVL